MFVLNANWKYSMRVELSLFSSLSSSFCDISWKLMAGFVPDSGLKKAL